MSPIWFPTAESQREAGLQPPAVQSDAEDLSPMAPYPDALLSSFWIHEKRILERQKSVGISAPSDLGYSNDVSKINSIQISVEQPAEPSLKRRCLEPSSMSLPTAQLASPPTQEVLPTLPRYDRDPCHICFRWFSQKKLQAHIESHQEQRRSFQCDVCDKSYSRRSKLQEHRRFRHFLAKLPCRSCSLPRVLLKRSCEAAPKKRSSCKPALTHTRLGLVCADCGRLAAKDL